MILKTYAKLTQCCAPLVRLYLKHRVTLGKEVSSRLPERYGVTQIPRPDGTLLWFHCASVGESLAVLPLIQTLRAENPELTILVTTITVTSAAVLEKRLPVGVIHQFGPLDVPTWVESFLQHWRPDIAIVVESEIWPNLFQSLQCQGIPLVGLNMRLSARTLALWEKIPRVARQIFSMISLALTPHESLIPILKTWGVARVKKIPNLKFLHNHMTDASPLKSQEAMSRERNTWAAVSTHAGEESLIFDTHRFLKSQNPGHPPLTLLAPRHPERCPQVIEAAQAQGLRVTQRSRGEEPDAQTDIWLFDTMGELPIVFNSTPIVLMGGTLIDHGGHNPIEPLAAECGVIMGPFFKNCADIVTILEPALFLIQDTTELASLLTALWKNPEQVHEKVTVGHQKIQEQQDALKKLKNQILDMLPSSEKCRNIHD